MMQNLNDWKRRQAKILTHIMNQPLHISLIGSSIVLRRRIALPLVPKQSLDFPFTLHALFSSIHHIQVLPTSPLPDGAVTHGAWHQPNALAPQLLPYSIGERHSRPDSLDLESVDVPVERLSRLLPDEIGAEAEDGRVWLTVWWDDTVHVVMLDAASTRHVALA